ncbi:hypothetical protein [Crossiella cryophila]|uniref:Uncharacterized protein n=1 Tax=Crossiella cryophila TaxID=43355 RepID=A0A7W7FUY3_9PSEU|nr:hypothetical protein [Crossiella cryophila]MBB4678697.1 hypothetical protein [Crossiella cryophila]
MYRILLFATRLCLLAFLLGGVAVIAGQTTGILLGSGRLVRVFGDSVADAVCATAALAGVFAFLLRYTGEGRAELTEE